MLDQNTLPRQNIMSLNRKIRKLSLLSSLSTLLLTGCQYLFPASPAATPASSFYAIETHNFSIDYEQNMIGRLAAIKTQPNDTLPDIARHFGLGYNDIVSANPNVDAWLPEPDTRVLLPLMFTLPDAPHQGIVLNLANMRMFHFSNKNTDQVMTYPVGIGRDGWNTPLGLTKIVSKTKNPTWYVPPSIQREHAEKGDPLPGSVPAGPDNPLGEYAMRLARSSYLIHGTNKPYGVGMQMSHGCLNLYPEDISELFNNTRIGTPVMIVNQPYLLGQHQDMLFLEAHKPLQGTASFFKRSLFSQIKQAEKKHHLPINWPKVEQVVRQANGIPTPILARSMSFQEVAANALLLPHPEQLYKQPIPRSLAGDAWSVTAATLADSRVARKLSALLNHQGPTIPSRTLEQGNTFQVVSGPFATAREAKTALKRIQLEFDLKGKINPPQNFADSGFSTPVLKKLPKPVLSSEESNFFDQWFN